MSEQMLSLYAEDSQMPIDDSEPFINLPTRHEQLKKLSENINFDLLILGGGLSGVVLAHEAALQGIKVLCLESGFFASDALSWDARLARQLRNKPLGVLAAAKVIKKVANDIAPHLATPMARDANESYGYLARVVRGAASLSSVNERLLIRETVLAARQEGAMLLAAASPVYLEAESAESGCYVVGFRDQLADKIFEARVGGVFLDSSCGKLPPSRLGTYVVPATDPDLAGVRVVCAVTPKSAKSPERFVSFELSDGSFISVKRLGLSIIEVSLLFGAKPFGDNLVLDAVGQAASESGWIIERELSRSQIFGKSRAAFSVKQEKGIFTTALRGPWDAYRAAKMIVRQLLELSAEPRPVKTTISRPLPGSERNREVDAFRALARAQGISERTIESVVKRWHGRVRYIERFANGLKEIIPGVLRGEIDLSVRSDQAISLDDLVYGSLALEDLSELPNYLPILAERLAGF
jgi:hypothetical protein